MLYSYVYVVYITSQVAQTIKNLPQCRKPGFDPWVRKITWRWEWQFTPVFLPEECHGQRSLAGHSPWGHKESDNTNTFTFMVYR